LDFLIHSQKKKVLKKILKEKENKEIENKEIYKRNNKTWVLIPISHKTAISKK
jgi:hypothetical protein